MVKQSVGENLRDEALIGEDDQWAQERAGLYREAVTAQHRLRPDKRGSARHNMRVHNNVHATLQKRSKRCQEENQTANSDLDVVGQEKRGQRRVHHEEQQYRESFRLHFTTVDSVCGPWLVGALSWLVAAPATPFPPRAHVDW